MIVWTPIAVNEKPLLRGKQVLPVYSAAAIGSSVILRAYGGGMLNVTLALTTIPFATNDDAIAWIAENKSDEPYALQIAR